MVCVWWLIAWPPQGLGQLAKSGVFCLLPCSLMEDGAAEPARPPVLVVMPDGQSLCTAREDAEWKAAMAAAESGEDAAKDGGLAAAAAAASSPTRLRWWERLPAGLGSPVRQQQQQQQQRDAQLSAPAASADGAVGIELAAAAPEPVPQQGALERSSRPGSALSASSSGSDSGQAPAQAQQQPAIVPPHRLRPSSWRSGGEAGDAAAPQRMARASTGQQLAVRQAGVGPPAQRDSMGPRPRRPVPIFDIEVPWEAGSPSLEGGSGGGSAAAASEPTRPGSAASGSSGLAGADASHGSGAVPAQPPPSLI